MKNTATLLIFILISSCNWFGGDVPDKEEIVNRRLKEINWNEVSSYPTIAECEALTDKNERKACFFETLAELVQEKLGSDTIAMLYPEMDTITMQVTVFADSRLKFEPQFRGNEVAYNKAVIDSILKNRLVNFPHIEPAQKEGIPVTTKFTLPVIINVQ